MIDILEKLKRIFPSFPEIEGAVLFGSRARGDFRPGSDYDVAIYGNLPTDAKARLKYFCKEELPTLHKVDLIFMQDQTDRNFIKNIQTEGIKFYDAVGK